jgi:hypothetical protein
MGFFSSSGPISYGFASLETSQMLDTETVCSVGNSSDSGSGPPSLQHEFDNIQTVERSAETDSLQHMNQATSPQSDASPVMPTNQAGMRIVFFKLVQIRLREILSFCDCFEWRKTVLLDPLP